MVPLEVAGELVLNEEETNTVATQTQLKLKLDSVATTKIVEYIR